MDKIHGLPGIDTEYERKLLSYRPQFDTKKTTQTIQSDQNPQNNTVNEIIARTTTKEKVIFTEPTFDLKEHVNVVRYMMTVEPMFDELTMQNIELKSLIDQISNHLLNQELSETIRSMIAEQKYHELFESLPDLNPLLLTQAHHHYVIANLFLNNNQTLLSFWKTKLNDLLQTDEATSRKLWQQKEEELESFQNTLYQDAEMMEDEWQGISDENQKQLETLELSVRQMRSKHMAANHIYYALSSRMDFIRPLISHMNHPSYVAPEHSISLLENESEKNAFVKHLHFDLQNQHQETMRHYHAFKLTGPKQYAFMNQHAFPLYYSFSNEHDLLLSKLMHYAQQNQDDEVLFDGIQRSIDQQRKAMQQSTLDLIHLSRLEADSAYLILRQTQKMEDLRKVLQNFM